MLVFLTVNAVTAKPINRTINQAVGYVQNKGQIIDQSNKPNLAVKYLFNGNGLNVQLKANGFSYDTYTEETVSLSPLEKKYGISKTSKASNQDIIYHFHRIDILFIGANTNLIIETDKANSSYTNYYTTGTSETGATHIKAYQQVKYKNLYNGIDLEFVLDENNKPKYNFVMRPGADASQIKWQYVGANSSKIENNKIILGTAQGNLEEKIPLSYLMESRAKVKVSYQDERDNTFSFNMGKYDNTQTLIIDPIPWATYYGGNGYEESLSVSSDSIGDIYISGLTFSNANIATIGSFQSTYVGNVDAYIAKFSNGSGQLLWATYFGGANRDEGNAISAKSTGSVYVLGYTESSSNIATLGSHQTVFGGLSDAMILKFSSTGLRIWSTYYGGNNSEYAGALAADSLGNIYVGGFTASTNNISTLGAHQTVGGIDDAYIAKFSSIGTRLWCTYYGQQGSGSTIDNVNGISCDYLGNVYVTGNTQSAINIATSGTHQLASAGGLDAYLVKFNPLGVRQWGTYFGGSLEESATGISVDVNSNIFISGYTKSTSGIASTGSLNNMYGGGSYDGFIAKFNTNGLRLWATYYGGNAQDWATGIVVDVNGNIGVCGLTESSFNVASIGAYKTVFAGSSDVFLAKFNTSGTRLWATYYGGTAAEDARGIATDATGNYFICGFTSSNTGIATAGTYQTAITAGYDAFLAAFTNSGLLPVKLVSFTAEKKRGEVLLNWQTSSETNNAQFEIERSFNNLDWLSIGAVKGKGTSNILNQYQYIDNKLMPATGQEASIYYRLKQIDFDGTFDYSKVIKLTNNAVSETLFVSNPFSTQILVGLNNQEEAVAEVEITDVFGKIYYSKQENLKAGYNEISLNAEAFDKGIYVLLLKIDDEVHIKKLIRQ